MLLAQILYGEGKYDDGIRRLQGVQGWGAAGRFAAAIEELLAAGYLDSKRYDEAATHFLEAAEQAAFRADRAAYRADAARAYQLAGRTAEARKIWVEQAADPESPAMSEARVRLGEIDARPAGKD
jgi:predicted negative regulator of RcsB-dependent stress response